MRRLVLVVLVLESILALVVVYGASTGNTDAAGRGLSTVYAIAVAAPVDLAVLLFVGGWTRSAGVAALVVPALAILLEASQFAGERQVASARAGEGWFTDPTALTLMQAISRGDTAAMRAAVAADPSVVDAVTTDSTGTMLTHAILNFPQMTEALLALGANPNLAAPTGMSPLAAAVTQNQFAVRALLFKGADPDTRFMREPVIFNAFRTGRRAEALALASLGADPMLLSERGQTTALAAASDYMYDVAAVLVEKGADPLLADQDGMTLVRLVEEPARAAYHDDRGFQRLVSALKARGIAVTLAAAADPT